MMNQRKTKRDSKQHKPDNLREIESSESAARVPGCELPARPWLLAVVAALFVARPLVPSEGVAWLGDGQPFCMLWLLAALGTALAAVKGGCLPRRFGWGDLAVGIFVVLHTLAAWRGTSLGSPRPAFNMLWEGVAMAVSFLLVRQLVCSAREARAVVAVMIALAVVLSTYGFYQVFVSMPADRAEYASDADGMLRRAGQWYPRGSPERIAFENRLASTEPLATFALTNSLAGFLVVWLVVGLGVLTNQQQNAKPMVIAALLIPIAGCLVLTKSRSAIAALGLSVLTIFAIYGLSRRHLKLLGGALAIAAILIVAAVLIGGLDAKVLTEAGKSLGYRLQYWQSTIAMIRDRPLLGVGPGNFQDYYTQYKLPEASEEIRDPHNWMFEVAATTGLPALLALGAVIGFALWRIARRKTAETDHRSTRAAHSDGFVYGGAAAGFVVALIVGPLSGLPLGMEKLAGGLCVGAISLLVLHRWVREGQLSPTVVAVAILAILVNLLASGGILYPAVAGSLWLLLAVGLNLTEERRPLVGKLAPAIVFIGCAIATIAQYFTGYSPVLRSQGAMMLALELVDDRAAQERALLLAAEADPRAAEPWQEIASLRLRRWLDEPGTRALEEFRKASEHYLLLKPQSSSAYRLVGNWWRQIFDAAPSAISAEQAAVQLSRAVELYPNLAALRAELALAYDAAGEPDKAEQEATKALNLDRATTHLDKKLSPSIRKKIAPIAGAEAAGSR